MIKLVVKDIIGPQCGTYDDGNKVFIVASDSIRAGDSVDLDFDGVEVLTSSFVNGAIGNLVRTFGDDILKTRLTLTPRNGKDRYVLDKTLQAIRGGNAKAV